MDHSIEPTMKRVLVLPVESFPGAYICISGALRNKKPYGARWYSGHEEIKDTFLDDRDVVEPRISFNYVENGIAAEWDGNQGPIQMWFKSTEGYKDGYDESRVHWLWPFAFGAGHWSQLAVEDARLPLSFNQGDYNSIFCELRRWVKSRLGKDEED